MKGGVHLVEGIEENNYCRAIYRRGRKLDVISRNSGKSIIAGKLHWQIHPIEIQSLKV
jgi:hypothetical protein